MGIKNRQKIIDHISDLDCFVIGTMRGCYYPDASRLDTGKLPPEWSAQFKAVPGPVYVVWSYATPIAWHAASGVNDWMMPDVRYSNTTSHHQSLARQAATLRGERIDRVIKELTS